MSEPIPAIPAETPPATPPASLPPIKRPAPRKAVETTPRYRRWIWQGKFFPAFWTIAGVISLVVNVILIALLIGLARYLFTIKDLVSNQLIGGLHGNFVQMDDASIITTILVSDTITVNDTIPVVFDLPLKQDTVVVLTEDITIQSPMVRISTGVMSLNAPAQVTLPKGTELSIALDLNVPVNTVIPVVLKVPVNLTVPVNIPLNQTELHTPFVGLRDVIGPYYSLLGDLPSQWDETPLCGPALTKSLCKWLSQ